MKIYKVINLVKKKNVNIFIRLSTKAIEKKNNNIIIQCFKIMFLIKNVY